MSSSQLPHYVLYRLGLASAGTQTTPAEQQSLLRWATGKHRLVEIGVWHGANTRRLREVMAEDGVLTGVDPFPTGRLGISFPLCIARREIARSARGHAVLSRMTSAEAARSWAKTIDFLFIDGDHTYEGIHADWEGWSGFVAQGGAVCLHDSQATPERPIVDAGSVRFVAEVIARDPRFETAEVVETLTVLLRKRDALAG